MRAYQTAMGQYQNIKGSLAHYNQILRSRPSINIRQSCSQNIKPLRNDKICDEQKNDKNILLFSKLMEIRHRRRKSVDVSMFNKISLKNSFKQKQKINEIHKSNLKLYQRLQAVKSSVSKLGHLKNKDISRRQRFSDTLYYQSQVYKTFTSFLKSDNKPKMFLRTEISPIKNKSLSTYKVEVIQSFDQQSSKTNSYKKQRKFIKNNLKHKKYMTQQPQQEQINKLIQLNN